MARRKIALDVDQRTDTLTDEALVCRTWGHRWVRRIPSRTRIREQIKNGVVEYQRYCENGCGCTWRQVWSISDQCIVENERLYPSKGSYLMPPRSGRLKRGDAWAANFTREFSSYL